MANLNLAHERFIQQMILHGDRQKAYMIAYPDCAESSAYNSACRLLSNHYINARITEAVLMAQRLVECELQTELKQKALRISEQRSLLVSIATRQQKTTKTVFRYNKKYELEEQPTIAQTLTAIALYMQLDKTWKRKV